MTWLGRTLQNVEIFAFVGSSIGVLHLHTIKSGDRPSPRRVRTEFWIGFVFCSPEDISSFIFHNETLSIFTWSRCGNQWNMNIQEIVFPNSKFHLSKSFKEMHRFNISSSATQFNDANLKTMLVIKYDFYKLFKNSLA